MRYCLVAPGIKSVPPNGWGAVETVVWEYSQSLVSQGHEVVVINTPSEAEITNRTSREHFDVVAIHYDVFAHIVKAVSPYCKIVIIISHYGYLDQPDKWSADFRKVFTTMSNQAHTVHNCFLGALSSNIVRVFQDMGVHKLVFMPNGVDAAAFRKTDSPTRKCLCLGEVCARKGQGTIANVPDIDFVGPISLQDFSGNYLGEWSRDSVHQRLTEYESLVLPSLGEADPLVVKEALVCGLDVFLASAANKLSLDLDDPLSKHVHVFTSVDDLKTLLKTHQPRDRADLRAIAFDRFNWSKIVLEHCKDMEALVSEETLAPVTIVTGYWEIAKHKHSVEKYLEWMTNFMSIRMNVVLFTDVPDKIPIGKARVHVVKKALTQLLPDLRARIIAQRELDPRPELGRSEEAYVIWNSKIALVEEAIDLNPFGSTRFIWTDIGNVRSLFHAPTLFPSHFPQISRIGVDIVALTPLERNDSGYYLDQVHFSGSMMGAHARAWRRLSVVYYSVLRKYLDTGHFAGCDQQVLFSCWHFHPWLFHIVQPVTQLDPWFYLWEYYSQTPRISIVGPGVLEIPPTGWGAIESVIWHTALHLREIGWRVQIVNTTNEDEILSQINDFTPDIVHFHYDNYLHLAAKVSSKLLLVTCHFAYFTQPERWEGYSRIVQNLKQLPESVQHVALTTSIQRQLIRLGVSPSSVFVHGNSADSRCFRFTLTPTRVERSIYLGQINARKRQWMLQDFDDLDFAGNLACDKFRTNHSRWLGEWDKATLHHTLTEYGNLVLLSDGEADPLVVKEAMMCGLGVVLSESASQGVNTDLPFVTVVRDCYIPNTHFVRSCIYHNRRVSQKLREQIRHYALRECDYLGNALKYARTVLEKKLPMRLNFADFRKFSHCFVETGTARLDGVWAAFAANFTHVKSVEACLDYYVANEHEVLSKGFQICGTQKNWKRFTRGNQVLDLWFGMSQDCLTGMLADVASPVIFWLDAHVSGPASAGHGDWERKGSASQYAQDNVLTEELKLILGHRKDHILLIDDQNGVSEENARYRATLSAANPNYRFVFYDEQRDNGPFYPNKVLACSAI